MPCAPSSRRCPVYRTYVADGDVSDVDRRTVGLAVAKAREATPALDPSVFAFIESVLTDGSGAALEAAMRIQQYTGPVMAKGLEDTALYRFNRLIALSDVGEKPDRFTQSVASFHDFMKSRVVHQKHGMLTSSSHDTKRGEDTRARIAAISGHAEAWDSCVAEWSAQLSASGCARGRAERSLLLLPAADRRLARFFRDEPPLGGEAA